MTMYYYFKKKINKLGTRERRVTYASHGIGARKKCQFIFSFDADIRPQTTTVGGTNIQKTRHKNKHPPVGYSSVVRRPCKQKCCSGPRWPQGSASTAKRKHRKNKNEYREIHRSFIIQ